MPSPAFLNFQQFAKQRHHCPGKGADHKQPMVLVHRSYKQFDSLDQLRIACKKRLQLGKISFRPAYSNDQDHTEDKGNKSTSCIVGLHPQAASGGFFCPDPQAPYQTGKQNRSRQASVGKKSVAAGLDRLGDPSKLRPVLVKRPGRYSSHSCHQHKAGGLHKTGGQDQDTGCCLFNRIFCRFFDLSRCPRS